MVASAAVAFVSITAARSCRHFPKLLAGQRPQKKKVTRCLKLTTGEVKLHESKHRVAADKIRLPLRLLGRAAAGTVSVQTNHSRRATRRNGRVRPGTQCSAHPQAQVRRVHRRDQEQEGGPCARCREPQWRREAAQEGQRRQEEQPERGALEEVRRRPLPHLRLPLVQE